MELQLKPSANNKYPLAGILIKGDALSYWLHEIQTMRLKMETIEVYALPNLQPNTVWGCLIICPQNVLTQTDIRNHRYCQLIGQLLFIPEKTTLVPQATLPELEKLLSSHKHLIHPEIGLVELTEPLPWQDFIQVPEALPLEVREPVPSVWIPHKIKSFQIKPLPPEEMLRTLEEQAFPQKQKPTDKPLSLWEKTKLQFYKRAFKKRPGKDLNTPSTVEKTPFMDLLASVQNFFTGKKDTWVENLTQDYEDLEKRNQKALDRLLDMLKNDPDEALKYAIPLDPEGSGRGDKTGAIDLSMRWGDFSLFSNTTSSGSGGATMPHDHFMQLQQQYSRTAEELIRQKEFHKAAFVYMKLLKNHLLAAQTLENAHYYQEAASIYLKYLKNKSKAAECYEKGQMTTEAINLYQDMQNHEKVGDLYLSIHQKKEAHTAYDMAINELKNNAQYLKASQIYRAKLENPMQAQALLLQGWQEHKDAFNCLNNYFSHIEEPKALYKEIEQIYQQETLHNNRAMFLQVIKHEYQKHPELSERIREIAYEIIAQQISSNPDIVAELKTFKPNDTQLQKDMMRFKLNFKKSS